MSPTRFSMVAGMAIAIALLATACGGADDQSTAVAADEDSAGPSEQPDAGSSVGEEESELETILTQSASLRDEDPTVSLLLALEANRRSPGPATEQAILDSLSVSGVVVTPSAGLAPPDSSGCGFPLASEDGLQVFQVSDGLLMRSDMTTGEVVDHGSAPGPCGDWVGDVETGRKVARDPATDKWLLGSLDGALDVEITYDRPMGIAGRAILENRVLFAAFDASGVAIVVFDATTGDVVAEVEGVGQSFSITFGGDGSHIGLTADVPGGGGQAILLDAETGEEVLRVDLDDSVTESRFDLATGEMVMPTVGGRLLTVDIEAGEVVADVATAGTSELVAVGIRPDGLVVIAREDQIEIVDRRSGATGVAAPISSAVAMRVQPDGSVLKINTDATTEIINVDGNDLAGQSPEQWLQQACQIAGRDLTQDEWDRLLPGDEPLQSACA